MACTLKDSYEQENQAKPDEGTPYGKSKPCILVFLPKNPPCYKHAKPTRHEKAANND